MRISRSQIEHEASNKVTAKLSHELDLTPQDVSVDLIDNCLTVILIDCMSPLALTLSQDPEGRRVFTQTLAEAFRLRHGALDELVGRICGSHVIESILQVDFDSRNVGAQFRLGGSPPNDVLESR